MTTVNLENAEYKINLKDAMNILKVQTCTRKCRNCGKPFALVNAIMGQRVTCPECGAAYTVKQEIKFSVIIDPVKA